MLIKLRTLLSSLVLLTWLALAWASYKFFGVVLVGGEREYIVPIIMFSATVLTSFLLVAIELLIVVARRTNKSTGDKL